MDFKKICYTVLRFLVMVTYGLLWPFRVYGKENVPEGAAVVCANHTHFSDPFYMAFAVPVKYHVCLMAKQELFKFKPLGALLRAIGTFPVNRGAADVNAMKTALQVLKSGKKLGIFPEGTRTHTDGEVSPKAGAVRLAQKACAPLVPMYIPREKKLFRPIKIVIGEPISLEGRGRLSKEELENISNDLMDKIAKLGHTELTSGRAA